ncbi:MAG: polyprenol monophosphomannose synthase [Hydrogenothermaceae bacterium]
MYPKSLVVLPTYNERDNIDIVLCSLLKFDFLDVLVVDDNSTDGTVDIVKGWMKKTDRVNLIQRPAKLGLGTAYVTGFKWGLEKDYDLFFEMDSDLSHNPEDIPKFIDKINEGFDLVIGSRYMNNTISVVGWDFKRLLLSKFANWYATTILGLKDLSDITSGFRCYRRKVLETVMLDKIKSNGYSFQIEMAYKTYKLGFKVGEIPIIFYERSSGSSKMSRKIAIEAAIMVWRLKFGKNRYSCS